MGEDILARQRRLLPEKLRDALPARSLLAHAARRPLHAGRRVLVLRRRAANVALLLRFCAINGIFTPAHGAHARSRLSCHHRYNLRRAPDFGH